MYIYIYIHNYRSSLQGCTVRSHSFNSQTIKVRVPESQSRCLSFTSECPLKVQISRGLGPFFQIELLKTGRGPSPNRSALHLSSLRSCPPQMFKPAAVFRRLPGVVGTNGVVPEVPRFLLMNFHGKTWAKHGKENVAKYCKKLQDVRT